MRLLTLLLLFALGLTACEKDGSDVTTLSHDSANVSGPLLTAGTHELAVQFTSNETAPLAGRALERVSFYLGPAPAKLELIVYGEGNDDEPGAQLYRIDLTNRLQPFDWNEHRLVSPVELTGEDLWLSIAVTHSENQQSVGCDAGPAEAGGDWLLHDDDGNWLTFRTRTGESVNWNIRGFVGE